MIEFHNNLNLKLVIKNYNLNKNGCQHRINFIAGKSLTCENPRGFSWLVFI